MTMMLVRSMMFMMRIVTVRVLSKIVITMAFVMPMKQMDAAPQLERLLTIR